MSNEYHSPTSIHTADNEPRLINLRFALRKLLAKTALADIYRANDIHSATPDSPEKSVLVVLVTPTMVTQQGFAQAWQQILKRPAPPSAAYPEIISYGENDNEYWLALNNTNGELLSEQVRELGESGLPMDSALDTLGKINHILSGIQAGPFGYLEPGAIQQTSNGYIILNAPLVKVLQQLTTSSRTPNNKFALHSGYISPSVAVGDAPVTEDDTFSSAALLYALVAGEAPYGERSTLSAVAQGSTPARPKKLSNKSWEVLSSSLAFQRKPREENPDKLLTALRKANKRQVVFPVAIAASLGLLAFAAYHLTSKVGDFIHIPEAAQQQTEVLTPEPKTVQQAESIPTTKPLAEVAQTDTPPEKEITQEETTTAKAEEPETPASEPGPNEPNTPDAAEIAKIELVDEPALIDPANAPIENTETPSPSASIAEATDNPEETREEQVNSLLKKAGTAISNKQIKDTDNALGALSLLRQVKELDGGNPQTKTLINEVLNTTFDSAEQQIDSSSFGKAQTNLSDGDQIIREFMVTGQLQRLVRLESKLAVIQQEDVHIKELLVKAREAISAGNLSKDDSDNDYALLYLNNLMLKQPNNPDGLDLLKQVTRLRQQTTRTAIQQGELEQAGTYLGESEQLIRKYRLSDLETEQKALNADYENIIAQPESTQEVQRNSAVEIIELQPVQPVPQGATENTQIQQPAPIAEQVNQLPVEKLPVNPISVQQVETVVIDEIAPIEEVLTENIPELNTTTTDTPIWETGVINHTQNQQPANRDTQVINTQPQTTQTQPVIRYEPQQIPQPQNRQPAINNNNQQEVYTYQPTNPQLEPTGQPVFNDFNAPANPVNQQQTQSAVIQPTPIQVQQQQQVQPVQQQRQPVQQPQYQPQQPAQIPEMQPLDMIPELEEIPLSDIEGILPTN